MMHRESSVDPQGIQRSKREKQAEDASQRRHHRPPEHEDVNTKSKPLNIAMMIYNGVVAKNS